MTQDAVFYRPGNLAIVTRTTELSLDDLVHVDVVAASLELESEVGMANLATEAYAMEPVREDHRAHASGIRIIVDYHVSVFSHRRSGFDKNSNYD